FESQELPSKDRRCRANPALGRHNLSDIAKHQVEIALTAELFVDGWRDTIDRQDQEVETRTNIRIGIKASDTQTGRDHRLRQVLFCDRDKAGSVGIGEWFAIIAKQELDRIWPIFSRKGREFLFR